MTFLTFLFLPITSEMQVDIYNKITVFFFPSMLAPLVQKNHSKVLLNTIVYFVSHIFEVVIDVFYQYTRKLQE